MQFQKKEKRQTTVRFDSHHVRLRTGEVQRKTGSYMYRWTDKLGKRNTIYAATLEDLREQEEQILVDQHDGIKANIKNVTVNDVYELWCQLKRGIKDSTMKNYIYMYELFVKPTFGKKKLVQVKKSDVRRFYNQLIDDKVLKPSTVDVIHKKVLWIGACGHEWSAEIRNRVRGAGCPYCSHNAVLQGFNDLATVLPQVAKEWSPRNAPLKPTQVTPYANRKVWWKCEQGHEWFTLISTRAYGSKCPYCSGIKLLKGFNDLASLHPQLALEWSQKNGTLLPEDVNERSTKNVWWKCSTCGHEYRAVIKSKVHGLKCPVCTRNAVLPGYSDLATTDPELAKEWNAAKNTRKPTEISRLSQYPVWWKGICGHEWKDKVFHRAVEGAGCIYCEKAFLKELPYLLVTMYAKQYGLATRTDDEKLIGARIDAVIPELRLAFAFSQKGTDREAKVAEVLHFLCKAKRIQLFVIRQKDPIALATEIKQAFAKANLFINSDSQRDVAHLRKRYFAQKNNGN